MEEGARSEDPETQLEEPTRQLSLGEPDYPQRPEETDCEYYMRTGSCGYGEKCRYNHPRNRSTGTEEYPERIGGSLCQYFMKTGTCKFGANCKFHHPTQGQGKPVYLNSSGYPLRPEEKECSYYMKTGQCKFGASCKFNHRELTQSTVAAGQLPAITSWQSPSPARFLSQGSYFPGNYGPTLFIPGVVPISGWSPSPSHINTVVSAGSHRPSVQAGQWENFFPERPGQTECQHYIRTGTCKFGSACKYHHPRESKMNFSLGPLDLPLRPGALVCAFYIRHGICKFGPSCKYDHPMGTIMGYPASFLSNFQLASLPTKNISFPTIAHTSITSSQDQQQMLNPG